MVVSVGGTKAATFETVRGVGGRDSRLRSGRVMETGNEAGM